MELSGNNGVVHNDLIEGSSGSMGVPTTHWLGGKDLLHIDIYVCTKVSSCKKAKKHISAAELNHHFIHKMNQLYRYEASQNDIWDWIQDVMAYGDPPCEKLRIMHCRWVLHVPNAGLNDRVTWAAQKAMFHRRHNSACNPPLPRIKTT